MILSDIDFRNYDWSQRSRRDSIRHIALWQELTDLIFCRRPLRSTSSKTTRDPDRIMSTTRRGRSTSLVILSWTTWVAIITSSDETSTIISEGRTPSNSNFNWISWFNDVSLFRFGRRADFALTSRSLSKTLFEWLPYRGRVWRYRKCRISSFNIRQSWSPFLRTIHDERLKGFLSGSKYSCVSYIRLWSLRSSRSIESFRDLIFTQISSVFANDHDPLLSRRDSYASNRSRPDSTLSTDRYLSSCAQAIRFKLTTIGQSDFHIDFSCERSLTSSSWQFFTLNGTELRVTGSRGICWWYLCDVIIFNSSCIVIVLRLRCRRISEFFSFFFFLKIRTDFVDFVFSLLINSSVVSGSRSWCVFLRS